MNFSKIGDMSSKAFGKIDKATGTDLDLEVYSKLDESAFQTLLKEYGSDDLTKYIKEMEFRRLNNGKKLK